MEEPSKEELPQEAPQQESMLEIEEASPLLEKPQPIAEGAAIPESNSIAEDVNMVRLSLMWALRICMWQGDPLRIHMCSCYNVGWDLCGV
jgi:hypothetical protein